MMKFWRRKNQGNAFVHFFNFWVAQGHQGENRRSAPVDYRRV